MFLQSINGNHEGQHHGLLQKLNNYFVRERQRMKVYIKYLGERLSTIIAISKLIRVTWIKMNVIVSVKMWILIFQTVSNQGKKGFREKIENSEKPCYLHCSVRFLFYVILRLVRDLELR